MFEVIRVEKTKDYTVISNRHLKDTRLSLKAKGLMTMMLSLPDGTWELSIKGLTKICKDGKAAIMSALKELESAGYYSKRIVHENGAIVGWIHTVSEIPRSDYQDSDFQDVENQDVENQDVGFQDVGNQPQLNTKESSTYQSTTYPSNTYKCTPRKKFIPPTVEEVQAYCDERKNNVDAQRFVDYYEARDWTLSNGKKMNKWKSSVITWEGNNFDKREKKDNDLEFLFKAMRGEA